MLRSLPLKAVYRSDADNLVEDFYIPCLRQSKSYDRAVGYFSAAMLSCAAQGVATLLENGGRMRLIFGGELAPEDAAAIERGYDQRLLATKLGERFLPVIDNIADSLVRCRLDALAWMVANGHLEIKVALKPRGMYHEKIGVFTDSEGDRVVFQGSANETQQALLPDFNFESINVFQSWRLEFSDHFVPYVAGFESLWSNKTRNTVVLDFPEAAREHLVATAKRRRIPDGMLEVALLRRLQDQLALAVPLPGLRAPAILGDSRFELKEHQRAALNAWKARDFNGILAMATGSGKTITALYGAAKLLESLKSLFVVIAVPYQALADQWVDIVAEFGVHAIRCYGNAESWKAELSESIGMFQSRSITNVVCIVVNRTLQGEDFQSRLRQLDGHSLLFIGDECHHHSSAASCAILPSQARFRLGLSATPDHYWDGESNERLHSYYGDVAFTYSLENALADGVLTPYRYFVHVVDLTSSEAEAYLELTDRIRVALAGRSADDVEYSGDDRVKQLLFRRARLLGNAERKLATLQQLLRQQAPSPFHLFYCGDGWLDDGTSEDQTRQVDQVCRILSTSGWRPAVFTAQESRKDREQILSSFRLGFLDALVAIRCLDEGIDVPDCRVAYILASSRNPRQFVQRRGRILRRAPGKEFAEIHDFVVKLPSTDSTQFSLERSLIVSELRRVSEFVNLAVNRAEAYAALLPLLTQYDAQHHF